MEQATIDWLLMNLYLGIAWVAFLFILKVILDKSAEKAMAKYDTPSEDEAENKRFEDMLK